MSDSKAQAMLLCLRAGETLAQIIEVQQQHWARGDLRLDRERKVRNDSHNERIICVSPLMNCLESHQVGDRIQLLSRFVICACPDSRMPHLLLHLVAYPSLLQYSRSILYHCRRYGGRRDSPSDFGQRSSVTPSTGSYRGIIFD
ncbi:hypothetical protein BJY04DRAFT_105913 [Aspergillus karnatakaensis]|uniref:uncharacterized protein n=1 Tax=Aspergillus karnatakaensis TaxID=1810916 RepID=UPI003CCD1993